MTEAEQAVFTAAFEAFRRAIATTALHVDDMPGFLDLDPKLQTEALATGTLVGMLACAFAGIDPEERDRLLQFVIDILPEARAAAEKHVDAVLAQKQN